LDGNGNVNKRQNDSNSKQNKTKTLSSLQLIIKYHMGANFASLSSKNNWKRQKWAAQATTLQATAQFSTPQPRYTWVILSLAKTKQTVKNL
jgi:hypothetical protein